MKKLPRCKTCAKWGHPCGRPHCYSDQAGAGLAEAAVEVGLDSLWTVEHVLVPKDYQSVYPYHRSGRLRGPDEVEITTGTPNMTPDGIKHVGISVSTFNG